ncbi:MAG: hypothetical protein QF662_07065, partial [Phycisphaerae bacterium]|nr:hypothetical protein [Phycisphaerae bacterium]
MILMILAVAMMVLMGVIYSLPRFIESWFGSGRASLVLAEVYGKPVTRGEKWSFGRRLTIAGQAAFAAYDILAHKQLDNPKLSELRAATLGGMSPFAYKLAQATRGGTAFTNDDLWAAVAVYAEARQAGFEIPDAMLKSKLEALRHYGLTPADYTTLLRRVAGGRQSVLFEAWRQDMALTSYVNFIARMPRVIGGEVEQRFRRLDEKVRVALVVLKGDDFIKQVKSLSPDKLKRQFETHKKFLPGGGGPGGIGYKIPEKVEFEYLVTGPDTFADQVKISDEDIAKYYDENKDLEFVVEPEKKEDDKKEGGEKSDDEKKERPEKPKVTYRPLDEVKDRIRTTLHDQRSRASAAAHMVSISNELTAISARRTKINFETFADGTKVRLVRPKGFRQREELAKVKGIGEATSEGGEKFPDYALSITSLKAVTGQPALLDVGQPSGVLVDETGNQYIFRCTAVRKARVPASIDEVREAVEGDVR